MSKRTLPLWLRAGKSDADLKKNVECAVVVEPLNENNKPAVPAPAAPEEEPPKRRLRSNYQVEESKQPDLRVEYLPFVSYTGAIEYYTTFQDVAFSCDQMMQWVEQQQEDRPIPIAFDLEWPFSFQTGPGRTALMQLCAAPNRCLLLQLSCLQKLPAALLQLLYHPRVLLHGVNVKNDFRKLARDFPAVSADLLIERCVELGQWYNRLHGTTGIWSLARLVEQVLRQRVSKDKRVRMSKWNVLPLSDDQKLYAAIDVYVGQLLYMKLAERQRQQEDAENSAPEVSPEIERKEN
uniref:3'-5' exonuclease n=1 Tax=Anopheles coluzzii TaxID=1518534 RepID=A0A6E8V8R2_ANOCL|nr:Werner Syndrome-like exonuclease [Anopheles coluzzii]XP_040233207.2 Werner Syndrome-like exonuclease [Anopheles coluzzii]XP_049461808.1 Werner Syndrome-like exonuclease [Anopheles coluzzii]